MRLFCFCIFFYFVDAYKVLVYFPFEGSSHVILGHAMVKRLLEGGFRVTYITPSPLKDPHPNLQQISVASSKGTFPMNSYIDLKDVLNKEFAVNNLASVLDMLTRVIEVTLTHKDVQQLMEDPKEKFDAVIVEWLTPDIHAGFTAVFECPLIVLSSLAPHPMVLSLVDDVSSPAYFPHYMSSVIPPFTFWERAEQLYRFVEWNLIKWLHSAKEVKAYQTIFEPVMRKKGRELPEFEELRYNVSLILGNSHSSSSGGYSLPQNYVSIGGYFIEDQTPPLSESLLHIMESSSEGVIYFSMGSMVKSKTFPDEVKKGLVKTFSNLKQTVIWKYEDNIEDVPSNVHIVKWAPQTSILAHTNCVLFISHGGLLSTTEAIHFGVPVLFLPVFVDQFTNALRATKIGYGKMIEMDHDLPLKLHATIMEMLNNNSYDKTMKQISSIYHHRLVPPGRELVHWVEHVVATRGAPHLRSPALMVPWYQKIYLDLLALVIIVATIVIIVTKKIKSAVAIAKKKRE